MSAAGQQDKLRLGFLTTTESSQGFVGGLLVTNRLGRPLEFQCTSPVKPNRTQELLYGPTLQPFIVSELIGKTLVEKAGVKPQLILIDQLEILELREHVKIPTLWILDADSKAEADDIQIGRQHLRPHSEYASDAATIASQAKHFPNDADWLEPFDRVREALSETIRGGSAA